MTEEVAGGARPDGADAGAGVPEEEIALRIARMRRASRRLAAADLNRRLEVLNRIGVDQDCEDDPLGRVLAGHRDRWGIDWIRRSVPIGVVALAGGTREALGACLLAGNACVFDADLDENELRSGITRAGFAGELVTRFDPLPALEIDALWRGTQDVVVAERVRGHRHVFVDVDANEHHAAYVATNAATHSAADTVVFHRDYPVHAGDDVRSAIETIGRQVEFLTVASVAEACETIDARSGGEVETVMSTNLAAVREFSRHVDAAVVAVNCSPAFVQDTHLQRELDGFTRTRWELHGEGQTMPLGHLPAV